MEREAVDHALEMFYAVNARVFGFEINFKISHFNALKLKLKILAVFSMKSIFLQIQMKNDRKLMNFKQINLECVFKMSITIKFTKNH